MLYISSKEACGVVLVVVVIIIHAVLFRLYNCFVIDLVCLQCPQIMAPYVILGLMIPVYTHFMSFGFGPCNCLILLASCLK